MAVFSGMRTLNIIKTLMSTFSNRLQQSKTYLYNFCKYRYTFARSSWVSFQSSAITLLFKNKIKNLKKEHKAIP